MTDTVTPAENTTSQPIGTLEYLDPIMLEIGDNVRDDAALSKDFLASITEHGVLVPITDVRHPDNPDVIRVRNGQRRTLAAREVGLTAVPVLVLPSDAADASQETIDRIVHQIVTNDQVKALTDAQRARGIQQMIDAGMSVTKVAKKLSVTKDTVKAAETAGQSHTAMQALDGGQISLAEAAAITEFEDDPKAVQQLMNAAGTAQFDHTVAQVRTERASAQALATAEASYIEQGYTLLDDEAQRGWKLNCVPMRHLLTVDESGKNIGADEDAITEPQHWGFWLDEYEQFVDTTTGDVVDEGDIDWNTEDFPDETPAEGFRHRNTVTERTAFAPRWHCLDPEAAGLTVSDWYVRNATRTSADRRDTTANGTHTGDQDATGNDAAECEAQRRQAEAEAQAAEAKRRERMKVITLNRLGDAAITVRRDWVRTFVSRKTPPKGASTFVAESLARDAYMLTNHNADGLTAELLGTEAGRHGLRKLAAASSDARAQVIALALVLGALEARTPKDSWRNVRHVNTNIDNHWSLSVTSGDYLRYLAANGYTLSPVEEIITGQRSADEVYDEYMSTNTEDPGDDE